MPYWVWIMVGVGAFVVLSLLVGLTVAAALGNIGRSVSDLYETEEWALAPPRRALQDAEAEEAEKPDRVIRLR
jgi:hypothetical protein